MEHDTLKSRNAVQYYNGALVIGLTVAKTARTTALALCHEHPYVLLFLLVFGVFLFPLSTTAIVGTMFLIFATSSTIFISVVFFAPALFMLTIIALIVWIVSVISLGTYRYIWAKEEHQTVIAKSRSTRYKMFRSTLEDQEDTQNQHGNISALDMSTPVRSLRPMDFSDRKEIRRIHRQSVNGDLEQAVRTNIELLLSPTSISHKPPTESHASDFFPRTSVEAEYASQSAASEAA